MGKRADLTMETFYDALAFSLANNVLLCFQLPVFVYRCMQWLCTARLPFLLSLHHCDAKIIISNIIKQIAFFVADICLITYTSLISFMDFIGSFALITHY